MNQNTTTLRETLGAVAFAVVAAFWAVVAFFHGYFPFWAIVEFGIMFVIGSAALKGCMKGSREASANGAMTAIVGVGLFRGFEMVANDHTLHPMFLIFAIFEALFAYAVGAAIAIWKK